MRLQRGIHEGSVTSIVTRMKPVSNDGALSMQGTATEASFCLVLEILAKVSHIFSCSCMCRLSGAAVVLHTNVCCRIKERSLQARGSYPLRSVAVGPRTDFHSPRYPWRRMDLSSSRWSCKFCFVCSSSNMNCKRLGTMDLSGLVRFAGGTE